MKKNSIWIVLLFVFMLMGCQELPIDSETPEVTETPIETIIYDDSYLSFSQELSIIDKATDYVFPSQKIDFFNDSRYPGIQFIDIEAFMNMMSSGLAQFEIKKTEVITITVPMYASDGITLIQTFELKMDPNRNRLTYNDFNFSLAIAGTGLSNYDTDLELKNYQTSAENALKIDLDPYGLDLLYANGKFYMPFDLANLVLTGYSLSLYRVGGTIYVIDDFSNMESILNSITLNPPSNQSELITYSTKFASLLFDYFYGLKSYQNIDSYLSEFNQRSMDQVTTIAQFSGKFQQFVFDSDDLHTGIVDYGYGRTQVSGNISPLPYSRTVNYINEYVKRCVFSNHTKPMVLYIYQDYYVLEVNAFDLDTKDVLKDVLSNIDPSKDIYIDLTCNGGGNIIGAVELLTYMTNLPIELNYQNATTGVTYTETYQAKTPRALSNRFFVMTTPVTYSAANLFTSLVKDMGLATIIGRPTTGGAAAVSYAVLPNNLIMTYSTPMIFINKAGTVIEHGITPDYQMDEYMNVGQYISRMKHLFYDLGSYDVTDLSSLSEISLDFETIFTPIGMVMDGYTIEYIDGITNQVIETYTITGQRFFIEEEIPGNRNLIKVKITAHYTFFGTSYSEVFYQHHIDELGESMDQGAYLLPIGETYQTTKHSDTDIDVVKIVVTVPDVYRILINGTFGSGFSNDVYSESGERIRGGWTVTLEPGTYYININLEKVDFNYTIRVNRMYDDNIKGTELLINETLQSVTLRYDFEGDTEWVVFTMPEEMKLRVHVNGYLSSSVYITHEDGKLFHPSSDYISLLSSPLTVILPKGTYLLKFHESMYGTPTLFFQGFPVSGDLSGDASLTDPRFGTLKEGVNTFLFEALWDSDIYTYEAKQFTELMFQGPSTIQVCLIEDVLTCQYQGQFFTLNEGTYHFIFTLMSHVAPQTISLEMVVLLDLSTPNLKIPIVIGEPFEVIIERDGDIDYYTLSVTEFTLFKMSMINGHSSTFSVYDALGNRLYYANYGRLNFQLPPGDYEIWISENRYNLSEVLTYTVTIEVLNIPDQDPNVIGWDPSYYRQFIGGIPLSSQVQGSIDYDGDQDVFIIEITTRGIYQFTGSNSDMMYYYLYDQNGDRERMRNNWTYTLEPGIYYLTASSSYTYITSPMVYTISLFKSS